MIVSSDRPFWSGGAVPSERLEISTRSRSRYPRSGGFLANGRRRSALPTLRVGWHCHSSLMARLYPPATAMRCAVAQVAGARVTESLRMQSLSCGPLRRVEGSSCNHRHAAWRCPSAVHRHVCRSLRSGQITLRVSWRRLYDLPLVRAHAGAVLSSLFSPHAMQCCIMHPLIASARLYGHSPTTACPSCCLSLSAASASGWRSFLCRSATPLAVRPPAVHPPAKVTA
jgi:hypothetical protein